MNKRMTTPTLETTDNNIIHPKEIINQVFEEAATLSHGIVTLEIHVRGGHPVRAVLTRSRSVMLEEVAE